MGTYTESEQRRLERMDRAMTFLERLDRLDWEMRERIDGRLGIWAVQALKQFGLAIAIYVSFWAMCLWASI